MRKQLTGEPVAGKPHTGFGGRGRRKPFPTPILRPFAAPGQIRVVFQKPDAHHYSIQKVLMMAKASLVVRSDGHDSFGILKLKKNQISQLLTFAYFKFNCEYHAQPVLSVWANAPHAFHKFTNKIRAIV